MSAAFVVNRAGIEHWNVTRCCLRPKAHLQIHIVRSLSTNKNLWLPTHDSTQFACCANCTRRLHFSYRAASPDAACHLQTELDCVAKNASQPVGKARGCEPTKQDVWDLISTSTTLPVEGNKRGMLPKHLWCTFFPAVPEHLCCSKVCTASSLIRVQVRLAASNADKNAAQSFMCAHPAC